MPFFGRLRAAREIGGGVSAWAVTGGTGVNGLKHFVSLCNGGKPINVRITYTVEVMENNNGVIYV